MTIVQKIINSIKEAHGDDFPVYYHDEPTLNLLEVNTTPGMTPTSFIPQQVRAAGLDIKDVLTDIIENKFN